MNYSLEITTTETEVITYLMKDGILNMFIKPVVLTNKNLKESLEVIHNYKADDKLLVLLDPTNGIAPNEEQRKIIIQSFTGLVKAKAVVNQNLLAPIVVNLMIKFEKAPFLMKMFKSEEKAIEWLNTFR